VTITYLTGGHHDIDESVFWLVPDMITDIRAAEIFLHMEQAAAGLPPDNEAYHTKTALICWWSPMSSGEWLLKLRDMQFQRRV
jgi:hypothetical protein